MSVPFGLVGTTPVETPDGPREIAALVPGDLVLTVPVHGGEPGVGRVAEVRHWTVEHLVDLDAEPVVVRGVAPGTGVWDAFEESFRAASSLSSLSELLTPDGTRHTILEVPERTVPPTRVTHLVLEPPADTFVAGGVVMRHKEP